MQRTVALGALFLAGAVSLVSLSLSPWRATGGTMVLPPRLLPIQTIVLMPCPWMDDTQRVQYEQAHHVKCILW